MTTVGGDEECPFCEIVDRDDPDAREVYRDEHTVAFFPTEPAVLGHTIVIPRAHVPNIWHLSVEQAQQLSATTVRVATAIRESLNPDGLNVIQSNGSAASQSVMHVHVHLVTRKDGRSNWTHLAPREQLQRGTERRRLGRAARRVSGYRQCSHTSRVRPTSRMRP